MIYDLRRMKKNGYTLVEIILVIAILVIMITISVGIFNAIGVTNKGRDSQRKKDLWRIKVAFEEYFNDKGFFPQDVASWNIKSNCKTDVFDPYLNIWPCDPNGNPYLIYIEKNKFRVITNLENKKDKDIPDGWYEREYLNLGGLTINDVNFGVSSTNIMWYEEMDVDPACNVNQCLVLKSPQCSSVDPNIGCAGNDCYYYDNGSAGNCTSRCKTSSCGGGGGGL